MLCPDGGTCHHACGEMCWRQKNGCAALTPTRLWPTPFMPNFTGNKWDRRGLALAKLVASWSKDPSTQCGAAVMRPDHTVASVGFNGFPMGCSDADVLYADREEKLGRVIHAEVNAVMLAREPLQG